MTIGASAVRPMTTEQQKTIAAYSVREQLPQYENSDDDDDNNDGDDAILFKNTQLYGEYSTSNAVKWYNTRRTVKRQNVVLVNNMRNIATQVTRVITR